VIAHVITKLEYQSKCSRIWHALFGNGGTG